MSTMNDAWDFIRNARLVRNATEYSSLIPDYFNSSSSPDESPSLFDTIHTFVMFVGVGRSGTTLLGALLDAHPGMVIAKQQCVLKYLYPFPFSRDRIYRLLLQNSINTNKGGWQGGGGYTYAVTDQASGKTGRLEVIGDKSRSAQSLEWFKSRPQLLNKLAATTQTRIRLIHVIRNPYDTIARRSLRRRVSLERISNEYFALTQLLADLQDRLAADSSLDVQRIPIYLEDIIRDPKKHLSETCSQLGVDPYADYLEACAAIVYREPSEPRKQVKWDPQLLLNIEQRMQDFQHLRCYSFDGQF